MANHVYVASRAKGFNFTVVMEDKKGKETRRRVVFEHRQFQTDDDALAAAIDEAIAEYPGISRNVRKADKAAAEELAIQHAAELKRTGAVKGGVTAEAAKMAMDTSLAQRDIELRAKAEKVDVEAFADENLQLTESAPTPPPLPKSDGKANTEPTPGTHEEQGKNAERPPSGGIKVGK